MFGILFDFFSPGFGVRMPMSLNNQLIEDMKKGIVIVLLSALVGGLTAFAVVRTADRDVKQVVVSSDECCLQDCQSGTD